MESPAVAIFHCGYQTAETSPEQPGAVGTIVLEPGSRLLSADRLRRCAVRVSPVVRSAVAALRMFLRSVLRFALGLAALYGVLRWTVVRVWQVPRDDPLLAVSLAPTLWPGDWVLLWRGTSPTPGALVVCPDPAEPDRLLVARWVAGGGDLVQLKGRGALWINERRVPTEFSCSRPHFRVVDPTATETVELSCAVERLGRSRHSIASLRGAGIQPLGVSRKVPDDHLYLVSDNRHAPFDSREFGPLPLGSCPETVRLRLASPLMPSGMGSAFRWIE